jgi:hypothetical protein
MNTKTQTLAQELAKISEDLVGETPVLTRLVWGMLMEQDCGMEVKNQSILDIAQILFPGFGNVFGMTAILANEKLTQPALLNQYPQLTEFNSADEAVKQLGESIILRPVKKSDGEEWQDWIEIIEPDFNYQKWRNG